jgi:hypothetical protein
MKKTKILPVVALALALAVVFAPLTTQALPPANYVPGSEALIFDHTFAEVGGWTKEVNITDTDTGNHVELIMHHVNYDGTGAFEAALLAVGDVYDAANDTHSTFPYQLFGMHFTTPSGHEIFTGAVFAFMFAFNDTGAGDHHTNNVRDADEDFWFVVPYGWDGGNRTSATPVVSAITMDDSTPGEYRFGVTYENLYARIVDRGSLLGFLLTLGLPLFEVQISELTFEYVVTVDEDTGEITAETYYTIGQVQALYALGQEIPIQDVHDAFENVTVGAAHFVSAWGSNYYTDTGSTTPSPAADWQYANITTDAAGNQRAFAVGVRGTYDLLNESDGNAVISSDNPAYSWIMTPLITDLLLVAWQFPFSADILALWAYAVASPTLQALYDGPLDLYQHADTAFNNIAFWYAITFPAFGGYRVVHDPVYTAYSNIGQAAPPGIPGFPWEAVLIGVVTCLVAVFVVRRRKKI